MCPVFVKDVTAQVAVDVAGDRLARLATGVGNDRISTERLWNDVLFAQATVRSFGVAKDASAEARIGFALYIFEVPLPSNVAAFSAIAGRLANVSLLALGRFRANSQLNLKSRYLPRSMHDEEWMTGPINALASISAETALDASPTSTGVWHL
jgi:hypothetical protein